VPLCDGDRTGSCVEGIRVDVGLKKAEALFALPCVFCGWIRRLGV